MNRDLILDVGAHRGEDAAFYLSKGFRVVAVEADPDLAAACRTALAGHIAAGRCTVVEGAIVSPALVAAGARTVRFYRNVANSVWGTVEPAWAERNARLGAASVPIDVLALDFAEVLSAHGIPRYLKIDIEGADLHCVEALRAFSARPDYVSFEIDKTSLARMRREVAALRDLGYDAFQLVEQSSVPQQVPPSPAREGTFAAHRFTEGATGLFGGELPGAWESPDAVDRRLRAVRLGYHLLGDDGVMHRWRFRGRGRVQRAAARLLRPFTGGAVPGWHDLHARHAQASPSRG